MTPTKARAMIAGALSEIQENSGRKVPRKITGRMKPIGDLEGFDSLNGLELSVVLATQIGIDTTANWCVSEDGCRALSISEMVDLVCKKSSQGS